VKKSSPSPDRHRLAPIGENGVENGSPH
jgi:hypothetical protein